MAHIEIEIELLEDMHTGRGVSLGAIDATLARDRDGWPVIRASHVRGVWKDALRVVKPNAVNRLFGESRSVRGALALSSFYAATEPNSVLWASTAREEDSRAPLEDSLRTREYIPAGTHFKAHAWMPDGLEPDLLLAASSADCLGARRRRGDGLIRIVSWESRPYTNTSQRLVGNGQHLRLLLRAIDPLCLSTTSIPGNIIPSECYIRGQQLAGAIVGGLLRTGNDNAAKQWLSQNIHIGNAYPLPKPALRNVTAAHPPDNWHLYKVWPIPLCYHRRKPEGEVGFPWWAKVSQLETKAHETKDQAIFIDKFSKDKQITETKTKRPDERGFLFQDTADKNWRYYTSPYALRMRNAIPRDGTPDGSLFTQEELPERTRFIADIMFTTAEMAQQGIDSLQPFLVGQCLEIGRGGMPLLIEDMSVSVDEADNQPLPLHDSISLKILLTADLIARDDSLRFLETLDVKTLAKLCHLSAEQVSEIHLPRNDKDKPLQAIVDSVEIQGFNYLTGLPRLPAVAIRRGSVFAFTGNPQQIAVLRTALLKCQQIGLGERCQEGFGRFVLDFNLKASVNRIQAFHIPPVALSANPLEIAIYEAEKVWLDIRHLTIPPLVQWQYLYTGALQGDAVFKARLDVFKENCDKLGKRDYWDFANKLEKLLPKDISHSLFFKQLMRCYVSELGKQGDNNEG